MPEWHRVGPDRQSGRWGILGAITTVMVSVGALTAPAVGGASTLSVRLTGAGSTFDAPFFNVAFASTASCTQGW